MKIMISISQLSIARVIQVYVAQGFVSFFFIFLTIKILQKERSKLKVILSGYYISESLGIFFNFIYAPLTDIELVKSLNFITNFFIILGPIFLMLFCLTTFKGEENISATNYLIIIIVYGLLISLMILFPNGIIISPDTGWLPHWNLTLFIYIILIMTIFAIAPSIFYAIKIYQIIDDDFLKKKWKFFIIGISELHIFLCGTLLSNTLHNSTFRTIWAIISLFLALSGSYLVYYGVVSKLKRT